MLMHDRSELAEIFGISVVRTTFPLCFLCVLVEHDSSAEGSVSLAELSAHYIGS